jgi:hypothetical protein
MLNEYVDHNRKTISDDFQVDQNRDIPTLLA